MIEDDHEKVIGHLYRISNELCAWALVAVLVVRDAYLHAQTVSGESIMLDLQIAQLN